MLLSVSVAKAQLPEVNNPIEPDEPARTLPPATDFRDRTFGVTLHIPSGWNFERKDGVLSNFGVDVRNTNRRLMVRGVASLNYNPYPYSTLAGATFYYSVLPRSNVAACTAQVSTGPMQPEPDLNIGQVPFKHGHDQHGTICTEARDQVFTTMRRASCLRFDLLVNTFCSQTSGAMDLSPKQLGDIEGRLGDILRSATINGVEHTR